MLWPNLNLMAPVFELQIESNTNFQPGQVRIYFQPAGHTANVSQQNMQTPSQFAKSSIHTTVGGLAATRPQLVAEQGTGQLLENSGTYKINHSQVCSDGSTPYSASEGISSSSLLNGCTLLSGTSTGTENYCSNQNYIKIMKQKCKITYKGLYKIVSQKI